MWLHDGLRHPETVMSRHHPHTPTFESSSNSVRIDDPVHNDTKTSINQDNRNNDINNNSLSIPSAYVPASGTQNSDFDLPAVLIFRQCFNGRPPSLPVPPIKMSPSQYHQLLGELRLQPTLDAYVRDKLRLNYSPTPAVLIIKMLTPIHEYFLSFLSTEIVDQLKAIATSTQFSEKTRQFASLIIDGRSTEIKP